jgi:hypothetical protein
MEKRETSLEIYQLYLKKDLQRCTDSIVSYGQRWIVETVFSHLKDCLMVNMFIRLD